MDILVQLLIKYLPLIFNKSFTKKVESAMMGQKGEGSIGWGNNVDLLIKTKGDSLVFSVFVGRKSEDISFTISDLPEPSDSKGVTELVKAAFLSIKKSKKLVNFLSTDPEAALADEIKINPVLSKLKNKEIVLIGIPPAGWGTKRFQESLSPLKVSLSDRFTRTTTVAFYSKKEDGKKMKMAKDKGVELFIYEEIIEAIGDAVSHSSKLDDVLSSLEGI